MITSSPTFGQDLLDTDLIEPDPLRLLQLWLPPNSNELRPLMALATIDADGFPDSRHVLVSKVDAAGLHFHTDSRSRKAAQLDANPRASAALAWPDVGRQLIVNGPVELESPAEAAATFGARTPYLQLLAWANSTETAQRALAERQARWTQFAAEHPIGSLTPPPTWVGYVLRPVRLTFWRGDPNGPSNRVEYRRAGDGWEMARLPG